MKCFKSLFVGLFLSVFSLPSFSQLTPGNKSTTFWNSSIYGQIVCVTITPRNETSAVQDIMERETVAVIHQNGGTLTQQYRSPRVLSNVSSIKLPDATVPTSLLSTAGFTFDRNKTVLNSNPARTYKIRSQCHTNTANGPTTGNIFLGATFVNQPGQPDNHITCATYMPQNQTASNQVAAFLQTQATNAGLISPNFGSFPKFTAKAAGTSFTAGPAPIVYNVPTVVGNVRVDCL